MYYVVGEEIDITYSYWDGSGHRRHVKVRREGRRGEGGEGRGGEGRGGERRGEERRGEGRGEKPAAIAYPLWVISSVVAVGQSLFRSGD